jgi:hypothetical protein
MAEIPFTSNLTTRWIFLSPHLDDAIFSCGGLVSYLSEKGIKTEIWTIFSDQTENKASITHYAKTLHKRWETGDRPYVIRKEEDYKASQTVGAYPVHFGFLDCIYRRFPETGEPVVNSDDDLFGTISPGEMPLVDLIGGKLKSKLLEPSIWVCPLSLGGHVDHRIVRSAAEGCRKMLMYYADLPYAFSLPPRPIPGMIQFSLDIPRNNLEIWKQGVAQYSSQLSSFWKTKDEMASQYSEYVEQYNGLPLWIPSPV